MCDDDCCDCDCDCDNCCECCECCKKLATWQLIAIITVCICLFTSCFLIGFSVSLLHPLYYGLEYDENSRKVDSSQLVPSGRHFTGLGFSYLGFPRYQQMMIFSNTLQYEKENLDGADFEENAFFYDTIRARTLEGMAVDIQLFLTFTYTTSDDTSVQPRQLWDIFTKFGADSHRFLLLLVLSEVRDILTGFLANQIPLSRQQISISITNKLRSQFQQHHFTLQMANIINIQFPTVLDDAYTETQIADQRERTMVFTLQQAEVESETSIQLAQIEQNIIYERIRIQAEEQYYKFEAQANSTIDSIQFQRDAVRNISSELGFSNGTDTGNTAAQKTLAFLWIYALKQNAAQNVVLATDFPINLQ